MISKKVGVSYAKRAGRTGTRGFWPLDLDLRAKNRSARDLIVAVQIESGGSDPLARGAAARVAGGDAPAAALRRGWPFSAFLGSKGMRSGSGGTTEARVNLLGTCRGTGKLWTVPAAAAAVLGGDARRRARAGAISGAALGVTRTGDVRSTKDLS